MQAQSVIPEKDPYNAEMAGRPTIKPAPVFGQRLALLRKQRGWTQSELAKRLNSTVKMVTYYEREATNPTRKTIEHIAKVLEVSTTELMGQPNGKTHSHKPGPPSQLEERLTAVRSLPRGKQKVVLQLLDSFLQTSATSNGH